MSSMIRDYVMEGLEEDRSVFESLIHLLSEVVEVIEEVEKWKDPTSSPQ